MQSPENAESYQLVASRRRANPNTNPLYHYLLDHYVTKPKKASEKHLLFTRIDNCNTLERQALFFQLPFAEDDFLVFPDFKLIELHLTVDRLLLDQDRGLYHLPPSHAKLRYKHTKTTQTINVEVRFTHMGNQAQDPIRVKLFKEDGSFINLPVTPIQKEYIFLHSNAAQTLLQGFLIEKNQTQQKLLTDIEHLETQLILHYGNNTEEIATIELLLSRMTIYLRYNELWDGRFDIYQQRLDRLRTPRNTETDDKAPSTTILATTSSGVTHAIKPRKKHKTPSRKTPEPDLILVIQNLIDEHLFSDPKDFLDDLAIVAWIKTHIAMLTQLDELCLYYSLHSASENASSSRHADHKLNAQLQRIPTRSRLLDYFSQHVFSGHTHIVREIAPLLSDSNELFSLYQQFLDTIERDSTLRSERIATAHALYQVSMPYSKVLMSKKYRLIALDDMGLHGILVELYLKNNLDVFCMYIDQDMASDTELQLLLGDIPYHIGGAIISLYHARSNADLYLEKVLSRHKNILRPHIEQLDLSLYSTPEQRRAPVIRDMSPYKEHTLLRVALKINMDILRRRTTFDSLEISPPLFRILAQYISTESLIKETMKFFESSFFMTTFTNAKARSIYPQVLIFETDDLIKECEILQEQTPDTTHAPQLTQVFAFSAVDDEDKSCAEDIVKIAQILLTSCLARFQDRSDEEQITISENLYQLSKAAFRNQKNSEVLYLSRAIIFCCLSTPFPSYKFHSILLQAIFLWTLSFTNKVGIEKNPALKAIQQLMLSYIAGLTKEERLALDKMHPRLIARLVGQTNCERFFLSAPEVDKEQNNAPSTQREDDSELSRETNVVIGEYRP